MVYCNILWNGIIKDLGVLSTNIYEYREVEKHGLRLMALIEKHGLRLMALIEKHGLRLMALIEKHGLEKHGLRLMALIEKHGLKPHDTHKYRRQPIT